MMVGTLFLHFLINISNENFKDELNPIFSRFLTAKKYITKDDISFLLCISFSPL